MALFVVSKPSSAAKTGASEASLVIVAGSKPLRIHMADVAGNGVASAANEIILQRCSGAATGGTSITPSKVNPSSGTSTFSAIYDATAGLTYTADTIQRRFAVNGQGGYIPFTPLPGFHIPVPTGTSIAFKSLSGTSNIIINMSIEEVDD